MLASATALFPWDQLETELRSAKGIAGCVPASVSHRAALAAHASNSLQSAPAVCYTALLPAHCKVL